MNEKYKIVYEEYEIVYTMNGDVVIKDTITGKIYNSSIFKLFKIADNLIKQNSELKEENERLKNNIREIKKLVESRKYTQVDDYYDYFEEGVCLVDSDYDKLIKLLEEKELE